MADRQHPADLRAQAMQCADPNFADDMIPNRLNFLKTDYSQHPPPEV
jgi:hypothetical protein